VSVYLSGYDNYMKKKIYVGVAVVLVIISAVVLTVMLRDSGELQSSTVAQAKAKAKGTPPKCLADNAQLKPSADDKDGIEFAAVSQLTDVPAGTNTTVNVATYDGSIATGSEFYPKDYGTYNFTAKKDPSATPPNQMTWKMTSWTACKG
jgi:hypothetical protein